MVRSGAPPGRRNPRDVGQRLRSAGRLETAHVVVHHGLEVLAPELPVPYCGESLVATIGCWPIRSRINS
jgi:hypothetical protein